MSIEALSCRELVELVTDYLEDALPPEERSRFDDHLRRCDGCSQYLAQIRATVEVAGRVTPETIDPAAEAALLSAFRDWNARALP